MDYENENITERAKQSKLWPDLEHQRGYTLPYLLERYLLLENWRLHGDSGDSFERILIAELTTVCLDQEERIRVLQKYIQEQKEKC